MDNIRNYLKKDQFAGSCGIELTEIGPGFATAVMPVREEHLNGIRVVHGGAIFTLADLAFAAAANSHGRISVGINMSISYIKAAKAGVLTAKAEEVSLHPKLSVYNVRVLNDEGEVIALFQGTAYRKRDTIDREGTVVREAVRKV